jgi:hypothetical protein
MLILYIIYYIEITVREIGKDHSFELNIMVKIKNKENLLFS